MRQTIDALLANEDDWISAMATVACELHRGFDYFHWTGFYRHAAERELRVGPYQGGHGCLRISFDRGVCGAAARTQTTQLVADVNAFAGHIACSTTTQSEIVVPVVTPAGELLGVLDVDSDHPAAFRADVDQRHLESLCTMLGQRFAAAATAR
ncbi:MAG: GAF domain-containing protein [Planctomycetota bacterium]